MGALEILFIIIIINAELFWKRYLRGPRFLKVGEEGDNTYHYTSCHHQNESALKLPAGTILIFDKL